MECLEIFEITLYITTLYKYVFNCYTVQNAKFTVYKQWINNQFQIFLQLTAVILEGNQVLVHNVKKAKRVPGTKNAKKYLGHT